MCLATTTNTGWYKPDFVIPALKGFILLPVSQIQGNYYVAFRAHVSITKDYDYFKEMGKQLQKIKLKNSTI